MANVVQLQTRPPARASQPVKLTEPVINRMAVGQRIYDSEVGGFYARRGKRGISYGVLADLPTKVFKAKLSGSQTIEMRFRAKSPKAARTIAKDLTGQIKKGVDPREPAPGADGPTLAAAWADYRDDFLVKNEASPATTRHYEYCFKRLAKWHDKPLGLIARNPDALKAEPARLTKDGKGKIAANATLQFLGILYRHVVGSGKYPSWPAWPRRAYTKHKTQTGAHKGMAAKDLPSWWSDVSKIKNPVRREMLFFALLAGLRKTDVITARWSNVDEAARKLHVPKPKGGTERAFDLPLSQPMMDCIKRVRTAWKKAGHPESEFLFPSTAPSGHQSDMNAKGIKSGHALRYTFSNMAKAAGVWEADVAVLMNHKRKSQTASYHDPNSTPERYLEAMEKISARIMEAIES